MKKVSQQEKDKLMEFHRNFYDRYLPKVLEDIMLSDRVSIRTSSKYPTSIITIGQDKGIIFPTRPQGIILVKITIKNQYARFDYRPGLEVNEKLTLRIIAKLEGKEK